MTFNPAALDGLACPVCAKGCSLLDVVDLNKACETWLPLAGVPVYYALCGSCGFCFAPELAAWPMKEFEERIYNQDYVLVDPDYVEKRPRANAEALLSLFPFAGSALKHLDYGGGGGLLARLLREGGWTSSSYDPFVDKEQAVESLGRFDLITAFEVFEHVPDVQALMGHLRTLLAPGGLVFFSTILSDGNIDDRQRIDWWYASPRNGHISLFSRKSLITLAQGSHWAFGSISSGAHVFYESWPSWAGHLSIPTAEAP